MAWDEEKFGSEVQAWYDSNTQEERIKSGGYFIVGTTSDSLKSIGVKDGKISWGQSKVEKILRDHAEEGVDIDIIKQVPGIIEKPIVILKSKTVEGSLVLFGELKTKTGRQVMASISLTPARGGGMDAEISVITGAYTRRKNNIKNLLKSSYVLFVDGAENNNKVLAKVGGEDITESELLAFIQPFGQQALILYSLTPCHVMKATLQSYHRCPIYWTGRLFPSS